MWTPLDLVYRSAMVMAKPTEHGRWKKASAFEVQDWSVALEAKASA